jgi:predicted DNA-binding WGR domain protein
MLAQGEDPALERLLDQEAVPLRPAAAPAPAQQAPDEEHSLTSEQGSSYKFWRVALRGAELTVAYGRIGSAGQQVRKEFESAQKARVEMEKLVAEKLRKGYTESPTAD